MNTIIQYLKLPFSFNADVMLQEVNALQENWLMHYNTQDYCGEWKTIPMRSVGGNTNNAAVMHDRDSRYEDTVYLQMCPAIKSTVNSFQCEKTSVRVLNLRPGAIVKEHTDPGLSYEEGEVRIHIPLCTNEGVEFYVLEDVLFPKPGECWYMNFELKHRLSNNGITDRIHLVIDCVVNDWVRELFESATVTDCKKIPKPALFSEEEELRIIEQLQQQGSPTALQIASDMKAILHNRKSHG